MKSKKKRSIIAPIKSWLSSFKKKNSKTKEKKGPNNTFLEERKKLGRDACDIKINKR